MNKVLNRLTEWLKFEVPYFHLAMVVMATAILWRQSTAAVFGLCFLVFVYAKEGLLTALIDTFKKPAAPTTDDTKLAAVVASLNKAHANDKVLSEELDKLKGEIGKVNLRFAIKPRNPDDEP